MRRSELLLSVCGVMLLAVAAVLLLVHNRVAECVGVLIGGCQEVGFAYEAGGKLALLLAFIMFLSAALLGIFRQPANRRR